MDPGPKLTLNPDTQAAGMIRPQNQGLIGIT